jgi:hypothetical protein
MTRWRRLVTATFLSIGVLLPAQPAMAHGGGDATSNYRTRITSVRPSPPGLEVQLLDVDSTIRLTYTGPGTLVVVGYEGEPYLRIGPNGVEHNLHSPATYLNEDRYARVALPTMADPDAAPEWRQVSAGRAVAFHDHRTHWMDTVPPAAVRADPGRQTVIFDHWQIPLTVDGQTVTINGDLTWVPAPSRLPWVLVGLALAGLAAIGLTRRSWPRVALGIAAFGTAVFCIDTVGYWRAASATGMQRAWLIGWPLLAIGATAAMAVALRRRSTTPSASTALAALVVSAIGGWDRIDVVSHSQVQSAHADVLTRAAATACLALGGALLVRFLADLVPRALGLGAAGARPPRNLASPGTTDDTSATGPSAPVSHQP